MDCKAYQDLLIQLPYGELSKLEHDQLMSHVQECSSCTALLEENQFLYQFTEILSTKNPINSGKNESIANILSEINSLENHIRISQIRPFRKVSGLRFIRVLVNTAAVFLVGLFLIQQIEIKRNLRSLQSKIEMQNQVEQIQESPTYNKEFTGLSDHQLGLLVKEYDKLVKENSAIHSYLRKNYPEIYQEIHQRKNIDENTSSNL